MTEQQQMSPEDRAVWETAAADEAAHLTEQVVEALKRRVVALNVEVRQRDARLADLERLLAELRHADENPATMGPA